MNKSLENTSFKIFCFRAIDEPELCQQYLDGHRKVLTDYGIENVTTNNNNWVKHPHIYCTVAQDLLTQELVGGVRIQIADGIHPLPVEDAIGYMDPKIYDKVKEYALKGGISESCGLWISKKVKKVGLSRYLMWASIASSYQLNFQTMLGICAGYTLILFSKIGFVIDESLGNDGGFPYPNDNYLAHVIGILNAKTLSSSSVEDREVMLSLRETPIQSRVENNNGIITNINYNVTYKHTSIVEIKNESMYFKYKEFEKA